MSLEEPLRVTFDVRVGVEHAFRVWTRRTGLWWPKGHTVTGDPDSVSFEPFAGGRIVERGKDGSEHVWGEVTAWDEPRAVSFRWHLFFDRAEATDVTVTFEPDGDGTRVELTQTGFEALGDAGPARREGNTRGWAVTTAGYRAVVGSGVDADGQ